MLEEGKLIAIRTHTRFVHFPLHRHNYVEVLYVCEGTLTNIIDGKQVIVRKGELSFSRISLPIMRFWQLAGVTLP